MAKQNKYAIEGNNKVGCGAGNITRAILQHIKDKPNFACFDNHEKMLELCKKNLSSFHGLIYLRDILETPLTESYFDGSIVHSHGVLEHFEDSNIERIINNHKSARCQLHYIPSNKYKTPSRGDERLLPKEYWSKYGEVFSFNNGFDLVLKI